MAQMGLDGVSNDPAIVLVELPIVSGGLWSEFDFITHSG
jgi:hypothetical protein